MHQKRWFRSNTANYRQSIPDSHYDGDGKTDRAIYDDSIATFYVIPSGGGAGIVHPIGTANDVSIPIAADYNGDGFTDFVIYDRNLSEFFIDESFGPPTFTSLFGNPSDVNIPISGDFDGDGKTDIAIYDQTTAIFRTFSLSGGGSPITVQIGTANQGDTPLVGDYNGDGKSDFAVYDPSQKKFLVSYSTGASGGASSTLMTFPSSLPAGDDYVFLTGNYQGIGLDFAIFDTTTSTFYVYTLGGTLVKTQQLGPMGHGIPV